MNRSFWNIWVSYATFYFGKVNLSIVIPVLLVTYKDMTLYNVGMVSSGFMIAYAAGQFLHGQISEKFNPLTYIAVGLIGSAIIDVALGFSAGFFWVLMIAEIINGGFQSMGWSSTVRANAETSANPDKTSTILGTAYQAGNSIAWLVCAFAIGQWGWQWGFWIASIVMFARGITLLRQSKRYRVTVPDTRKFAEQAKLTLNRVVVFSGVSLCLLNIVRFGIITWIPTYLYRVQNMAIEKVGLNIFLIPIAGIIGTLLYNRIRTHKDISTIVYLTFLGVMFLIFPLTTGWGMVAVLLMSGFFLYGPHVFLVTTMPTRFQGQKIVAASTGFIDGMGYIGSAIVGILVPFIIDKTGNWASVFHLWAGIALIIIIIVGVMYLKTWRKVFAAEYMEEGLRGKI